MMHIDVHTIIIILIIGNLVSLFLFTVQGAESRLPASDKYYLAGRIMQSCAWALIAFSAGFPNSMPYRSGGVILVAGFAAEALAMLSPLIAVQAWLRRLILLLPLIALINILNPADLGSGTVTGLEAVIFAFPFFISGFILCTGWNDLSRQSRMTGILNLLCSLFLLARAIVFLGSGDELSVPSAISLLPGNRLSSPSCARPQLTT